LCILPQILYLQINMNADNYPIEMRTIQTLRGHEQVDYWREINLSSPILWKLLEWLSDDLNIAMNFTYPEAPFPTAMRNFQRIQHCLGCSRHLPIYWSYTNICFIQAQARKIQKFLVDNRSTEVAMPCAEDC